MRVVGLMLAGTFLTLAVVGGFVALERTVLHWYAESDEPAFTEADVLGLATSQVVARGDFPPGVGIVRCVSANYRSVNRVWVVTCESRVPLNEPFGNRLIQRTIHSFDDRTGKLVR